MLLTNHVALLTGTKRIGGVVAAALGERGADVALVYNRSKAEARGSGRRRARARPPRARRAGGCLQRCRLASLMAAVDREFGRLDVLVNMASIYTSVPFDELDAADVGSAARGRSARLVPLLARARCRSCGARGGGRIINFSDWVAASGRPRYKGYLAYYVAKAGVKALTEALALELAADQILVNAIAPGPILAPPETTEEESEAVERATPLGRWGGPDEIAKAVLALVESDFITGETIRVDGGRHLS